MLVTVVMVGLTALERAIGLRINAVAVSFLLGVLMTATLLVLVGLVVVFSGGVNWFTGAQAERWTGEALQRLGPDWQIAHNLKFTAGSGNDTWTVDVDHVAVGPRGVLVVETKYSSSSVDLDAEHLSKQVRGDGDQLARNVRRVQNLFSDMVVEPPVLALLIYWGFRVTTPKEPIRMLGRRTHVVMGADADRWLPTFVQSDRIDPDVQDDAWRRIKDHRPIESNGN